MNLPHTDATYALLEEHFGIGATIEHHGMTAFEWQDYAKRLKADNEALIATGWDLVDELRDAQAARCRLNTAAETKAARLEGEVKIWRAATYSLAVVFIGVIGGLAMGMAG